MTGDIASGRNEPLPRLALNPAEVGIVLGISKTYAYTLIRDGAIRSKRVGSRWLIPVDAIREFLNDPTPVTTDEPADSDAGDA